MRRLFVLIVLLFSNYSYAFLKCEYSDVTIEYVGSTWNLTPKTFYVKEGDRVCIKFSTTDSSKSLVVQNSPIFLRAYPNKPVQEGQLTARKPGIIKVTCNGCSSSAEIIVQTKQEFEAFQRKMDRLDSLKSRNPHYKPQ